MNKEKIIMIAPRFFNIEKYIEAGLITAGYEVDFYDQRIDNSNFTKVMLRKFPKLISKKVNEYYQNILQTVDERTCAVFIIKAESVPLWFIKKIKKYYPNISLIHYMFDPVTNYPKILDKTAYFDANLTFDYDDSVKYQWIFRPLFMPPVYEELNISLRTKNKQGVFIGTLHTDRANVLSRIMDELPKSYKESLFVYLYIPLWSMYYWGRYLAGNFKSVQRKYVHKKPLSENDTFIKLSSSEYVIDIHHDNQTGLTFRTMEVLGARNKLITTNKNIKKYDFYHPNNILIIDKKNVVIDECWFSKEYVEISDDIMANYTVDGFIKVILKTIKNNDREN